MDRVEEYILRENKNLIIQLRCLIEKESHKTIADRTGVLRQHIVRVKKRHLPFIEECVS